jgi:phage terminase large subunit
MISSELARLPRETQELYALRHREQKRRGFYSPSQSRNPCERYQRDPVGYAREILGVRLTPDQQEIARSVIENRRTGVRSHHSAGKTFLAAVIANWWFDCWPEHICYVTAPTWTQAKGLTFKMLKRQRLHRRLPGEILETGEIRDTDRMRRDAHYIKALNAERGEGFQGEHTADVLVILEEAVGVPPYIWDAADSLLTSAPGRLLFIFNPTDDATPAGEMCRSGDANVLSMSALVHPNIKAELECLPVPCPGGISLLWLKERLANECEPTPSLIAEAFEFWDLSTIERALTGVPVSEGGRTQFYLPSGTFEARVLGRFPTAAYEQVIPRGWCEALEGGLACGEKKPEIGCDVARFGSDRTVVTARHGPVILFQRVLHHLDNLAVTGALIEAVAEVARLTGCDPKRIPQKIDTTGGLGTGPYDILKSQGYQVIGVNASEKAADEENFHNRRSELWFGMRDRVKERRLDLSHLARKDREELITELSTPKYKNDSSGRKVVEEKAEIKKRLPGRGSPDRADSLNLAFAPSYRWWEDEDTVAYLKAARGATPGSGSGDAKQPIEQAQLPAWLAGVAP